MKKAILFLAFAIFIIMYSCREGGRSDKYGNSTDTVFTSDSSTGHNGINPKVDHTSGARPNPDTSSYYNDSKKKK